MNWQKMAAVVKSLYFIADMMDNKGLRGACPLSPWMKPRYAYTRKN